MRITFNKTLNNIVTRIIFNRALNDLAAIPSFILLKRPPGEIPVLAYHKVIPDRKGTSFLDYRVDIYSFEAQMNYLINKKYKFLSINEFVSHITDNIPFAKNSVLLTFDDGSVYDYRLVFPILKKNHIPAIIFLPSGYAGTNRVFWWDQIETMLKKTDREKIELKVFGENKTLYLKNNYDKMAAYFFLAELIKLPDTDQNALLNELRTALAVNESCFERSVMNWDEIKEMRSAGVSFGAHTVNHVSLSQVDDETAYREIKESKEALESKLEEKIRVFAYPYGSPADFDAKHIKMLKDLGFLISFTFIDGFVSKDDDPFLLKRIHITGTDDLLVFRSKVSSSFYSKIVNSLAGNIQRILKRKVFKRS